MLVIIWSLATAMCGDRTSGIAGILIIMIVNFRFKGENRNSIKSACNVRDTKRCMEDLD